MCEKILFNDNWKFHEGDIAKAEIPEDKMYMYYQAKTQRGLHTAAANDFNDEFWSKVTLPHDYIIEQTPTPDGSMGLGYFKQKNAWYRKHFTMDSADDGKRICLFFESVATSAQVWLNGCYITSSFSGYTEFEADITDYVKFGGEDNVIAVYVNTTENNEGWWYEGGGIYGNVYLEKYADVSVDRYGIYVNAKMNSDNTWDVSCETTVKSIADDSREITAALELIYDDETVCTANTNFTAAPRGLTVAAAELKITSPHIWDVDEPNLYTVKAHILQNGAEIDCARTTYGFRTFEMTPKGMILNGKPVFINGVCSHRDFGLCGKAVPDNIHKYKVSLIKEMGANGYRCSHYPHPTATMDALDECGFIVMDEMRRFESCEESLRQLRTLVKRDRNRPSVFFWSVGNEEPMFLTQNGRKIFAAMKAEIRKLDPTRPVMCAMSFDPDKTLFLDLCDVIGINYNLDRYDTICKKHPEKMVFASECCATGTTRGWYHEDSPEQGYISAYDHEPNDGFSGREVMWKFLHSRVGIGGGYQWIAFEHRGECAWPRLCSQSGAIDMFMQKKDAFYQNQSFWSTKPMIHLLPHWNFEGREGEPIKVVCYTNCETAELFLNGKSLGKVSLNRFDHAEWSVPYESGVLTVKGYINGKEVCNDEQRTSGKAVALKLEQMNRVSASGNDMVLLTCSCIDNDGTEVPDAEPFVHFAVRGGRIVGTGSDICDHTPPHVPNRRMRAGKILVGVAIPNGADAVTVYAEAGGMKNTSCKIEID